MNAKNTGWARDAVADTSAQGQNEGWATRGPTTDINVESTELLTSPRELRQRMPQGEKSAATVVDGRRTVESILARTDHRMLIVVGPCSIHDENAAMEYAHRLAELRGKVIDRIVIAMRVYFEKPRTTVGWKGLINDPQMNGSFELAQGLRIARALLLRITELGVPTGTEFLDPITPQYLADLVCWTAIGARTTESQTHRQMASGLSMPVGFKNSTEGNVQVAVDAMRAAHSPHAFLGVDDDGRTSLVRTRGNKWGHVILRGGGGRSNFEAHDVAEAAALISSAGLTANLMVDCSHANSGKKPERQHVALQSVIEQRVAGNADLMGLMIESNLHEGNQPIPDDLRELKYGVSITDSCLGWEETEALIMDAYEKLGQAK